MKKSQETKLDVVEENKFIEECNEPTPRINFSTELKRIRTTTSIVNDITLIDDCMDIPDESKNPLLLPYSSIMDIKKNEVKERNIKRKGKRTESAMIVPVRKFDVNIIK